MFDAYAIIDNQGWTRSAPRIVSVTNNPRSAFGPPAVLWVLTSGGVCSMIVCTVYVTGEPLN
jgi:hypothetical protein